MSVIVAMTEQHIRQLMNYEHDMFGTEAWSAAAYREELADHTHRYYVAAVDEASDDSALLGWVGIRLLDDEAEILTVGVVPDARRRGIGTALLDELLAQCRRRSIRQVFLDVRIDNDDAQRIYARHGFAAVGRRRGYYDAGRIDSLTMSLTLEPADV